MVLHARASNLISAERLTSWPGALGSVCCWLLCEQGLSLSGRP